MNTIVAAAILLISVFIVLFGGGQLYTQRAARRAAETTTGTIQDVSVERRGTGRSVKYYPTVGFEYTVDDESYENDDLRPGMASKGMSETDATAVTDEYRPDQPVTVYYDPSDPGRSYLRDEPTYAFQVALILLGLVFGVVAVGLLL